MNRQSDPGIRVTGYRVEARIGRGGMGEVYRAEQLSLGRKVALKVLRRDLAADESFRRRFLRESMVAAGIDHPNVIPIYDAGEVDGLLYIAMRYVEGFDLATLLRREGRLDLARTLAIMTQVAGALDAAHARGLVHRDVKPSNILLAPATGGAGEYCYLCDFGLIKQMHTDTDAGTATDQLVGSVPYVAPEQVEGAEVDGRTDVYSLGCAIFHCLAGSPPYQGQTDVEVVFAHLRGDPPPLSGRVAGLPPALDRVLARAMARDKQDRYLTCSALVAAAADLLAPAGRVRAPLVDDDTRSMDRPAPSEAAAGSATRRAEAPTRAAATRPVASVVGPPATVVGPPAPAHRPPDRPGGGRRTGRRWLAALVLLPLVAAGAYLAAAQLLARTGTAPPPSTQVPPATTSGRAAGCAWSEPAAGTADRRAPLDAMRARLGVSGQFAGVEMRLFTGPGGVKRWYVKAYQQDDQRKRGRWLVDEQAGGAPQVVAEADYETRGYRRADWRPVGAGVRDPAALLPGCLAGT